MVINFCYDSLGQYGIGYPNLAIPDLAPDQFESTWPRVVPLRLLLYFKQAGITVQAHEVSQAPQGSWYPIALGWHDFSCDYFSLMSNTTLDRVRRKEIKILFYYHEGDNPQRIKQHIDALCVLHFLPTSCYLFCSANTAADGIDNFIYVPDHEYFFYWINRSQAPRLLDDCVRNYEFTALNRTHKWWRASVMSDLLHQGLLEKSQWSYNTQCNLDESPLDNPLELDQITGWRQRVEEFVESGPFVCDTDDVDTINNHQRINTGLYTNSYCHIILETMMDADQSGGTFITEKTYKCIKYAQPFVIVGPAHTLRTLREQGYRTFDHVMDNSYDDIENTTQRWLSIKNTIADIKSQNMHQWFQSCRSDLEHNQRLFLDLRKESLNRLTDRLNENNQ